MKKQGSEAGYTSPQPADHDRLSHRLSHMLARLYQGAVLNLPALADEFGVSVRTLQRDLARIGHILPLEKTPDGYQLDPYQPRPQTLRELEHFANASGLEGLYPRFDTQLVQELRKGRRNATLRVQGPQYEDVKARTELFNQLERAIQQRQRVSFVYAKDDGPKTVDVAPYQFINHSGVWYLAAVDGDRLKAYSFSKISRLLTSPDTFDRQPHIEQQLLEEDGIWLNRQKIEVTLHILKPAANYFRRRPLIAGQKIERELSDGSLIVSGRVAHANQILPIVRYWIPNLLILNPEKLQQDLNNMLLAYLAQQTKP